VEPVSAQTNRLKARIALQRQMIEGYRRLTGRLISQAEMARVERLPQRVRQCVAVSGDARCGLGANHVGSHRVDYESGSFLTWGR
jgi:hypothetical protein